MVARWIGGVPAIEEELMSATSTHIKASLLAESYDDMITHAFALFAIMFESNYWELIMNFREGLTEIELGQRTGVAIPLDSIRRVLVICDAHNLIRINRIREPAEDDLIKLTEPLYRILFINKDFFDYMIIIRGLASAMQYRMEIKKDPERSHVFGPLLDLNINWFKSLKEFAVSKTNVEEQRVLLDMLLNYDYSEDLDRIHRHDNWRTEIKQSSKIDIGKTSSHVLISDSFADAAKENMIEFEKVILHERSLQAISIGPNGQNILDELENLNTPQLNKMIVSVDWIINGVRDFYKKYENTGVRLNTRNFSASILTSRGMLFLDRAHSIKDVDEIISYVYKNTTTGQEKNILRNIQNSTIPKLEGLGLIELGENGRLVNRVMPYPVSSKYFVYKNFTGELYRQQINQFEILAAVQDFPIQKDELASNASVQEYFNRDYQAISEIDIIRPKTYNNIEYAVAKDYIMTNKESLDIWRSILETGSPVRQSFRDLMVLQGELGGYITEQDIINNLGWSPRAIYRMLRRADSHGLAKLILNS